MSRRPNKAFTLVVALVVTLLAVTGIDHLVASSRAADLCEAFRPGFDGSQVNEVMAGLSGRSGMVRVRGEPARLLTAPATIARPEFVQFAIVFKGWLFSTRQCVVSVKAGRIESNQVTATDAYVMLNPVQTVRVPGGAAR